MMRVTAHIIIIVINGLSLTNVYIYMLNLIDKIYVA